MAGRKNHIEALEITRALAILGVVFIHSDSLFLSDFDNPELQTMLFASRFAVPLFIMISGYLHKSRPEKVSRRTHYKKFVFSRFKRIIIPYFVFSIIYMAIRLFIEQVPQLQSFVPIKYDNLQSILAAIFLVRENPAGHLYFLPLLFFVVVVFCFFSEIIRNCRALMLACLAASALAYAIDGNIYLSLNPVKGIGFYALGYFIRKRLHEKSAAQTTLRLFALSMLSYILILAFNADLVNLASGYRLITLFIYHLMSAFFIFQLCFYFTETKSFQMLTAPMKSIGKYSYPIFLWHEPYIVSVLYVILIKLSVVRPFWNQSILILAGVFIPIIWQIYFLTPAKKLILNLSIYKAAA